MINDLLEGFNSFKVLPFDFSTFVVLLILDCLDLFLDFKSSVDDEQTLLFILFIVAGEMSVGITELLDIFFNF